METTGNEGQISMRFLLLLLLNSIVTLIYANPINTVDPTPKFRTDTSYRYNGTLFYGVIPSFQFTSEPNLNAVLRNQNAPKLGSFYFMGGLGWEERWKRFAIGIEALAGGSGNDNDKYSLSSTLLVSNITAKYYVLFNKKIGGIYPFGGITAINQSVYITDITNTNDINKLFTQSGAVNMQLSTGFVNFGIGFDLLDFSDEDALYGSFKIGYRSNIGNDIDNQWYVNEKNALDGSPTEKLNAFYFQFSIGYSFNTYSRKQKKEF